jgi:hypothetical protein
MTLDLFRSLIIGALVKVTCQCNRALLTSNFQVGAPVNNRHLVKDITMGALSVRPGHRNSVLCPSSLAVPLLNSHLLAKLLMNVQEAG